MAYQPVDIGAAPNDGTGDPIRDAFDKCNDNFVELYAGLVGLLDFKGSQDCSANPNYPAASKGDFYLVSVAGKIGGASGVVVSAGDTYFATADNAGGTQAGVGTSWTVIQGNVAFTPVNLAGDTMTGDLIVPDEAYDATAWNGNLEVPTKNAVRDKIESMATGSVSDAAYGGSWDGDTTTAPSKNAVYDKIETLGGSSVTAWKDSVRAATTVAGTLASSFENGDTIDGVVLATGDRILIKNQSSASENGIYVVAASGAPTRATDADSAAEMVCATVKVSEGTVNADKEWQCTTNAPITLNTTALTFAQAAQRPWWWLPPASASFSSFYSHDANNLVFNSDSIHSGVSLTNPSATTGTNKARIATLALPAGDFTLTSHLRLNSGTRDILGLVLYETATAKMMIFGIDYTAAVLNTSIYSYTNLSTFGSSRYSKIGGGDMEMHYRVVKSGSTLTFHVSLDGENFVQVLSQAQTTDFTTAADRIGFGSVHSVASTVASVLTCDRWEQSW